MENLDLKLINILINNRKELSDFAGSAAEGIFNDDYKRFVKTLLSYYSNFSSPPTLNTLLETCGNNNNLKEYVNSTWEEAEGVKTDPREYSFILDKINKRYNASILLSVKDKLESLDDLESVNNFIYKAANEIKNIGEKRIKIESTLRDSANDYFQKFKAKQDNKELNRGVMSGFSVLDYHTNGLRNGELLIVAGSTGTGKSVFLLNYAVNAWLYKNKFPKNKFELNEMISNDKCEKANNILFFSLEMSSDELKDRIISNLCSINNRNLMVGDINQKDAEQMSLALNFWKKYKYNFKIVDLPGCTMSDLQNIYEETCNEFKPDMVFVDYLGIMGSSSTETGGEDAAWKKLLDLSKDMFNFARKNNVPVATAAQMTLVEPGKGGIGVHRIGHSRGILQNTTLCLQIEDREMEAERPDSKIHAIKFRRGSTFVMSNLLKLFEYSRFEDQPISNSDIEKQSELSEEDLTLSIDKIFGQEEIKLE
jgi:replicative DNA helicase